MRKLQSFVCRKVKSSLSLSLTSFEYFLIRPAPLLLGRLFELHHVPGHVHRIPAGILTPIRDHVRVFYLQNETIRLRYL